MNWKFHFLIQLNGKGKLLSSLSYKWCVIDFYISDYKFLKKEVDSAMLAMFREEEKNHKSLSMILAISQICDKRTMFNERRHETFNKCEMKRAQHYQYCNEFFQVTQNKNCFFSSYSLDPGMTPSLLFKFGVLLKMSFITSSGLKSESKLSTAASKVKSNSVT